MKSRARILFVATSALGALGAAVACSSPDTTARVDPIGPSLEQFAYVAPVLSRRCGSLDCHGSVFRNMRVYGYGGQRLGEGGLSPESPNRLTPDEVKATYDAVIGLEPEIMREVVQSGGKNPERLTFVRKGRGDEGHKGDRRITPGDPSDLCITSWLAGSVRVTDCNAAACVLEPEDASSTKIGQCP
jgi:hypothetical protein